VIDDPRKIEKPPTWHHPTGPFSRSTCASNRRADYAVVNGFSLVDMHDAIGRPSKFLP
jgi:hypothetical protein